MRVFVVISGEMEIDEFWVEKEDLPTWSNEALLELVKEDLEEVLRHSTLSIRRE